MECLKDLLSVFVCVCEYARVCWYTHTIVYGLHHTCGGGRLAGMGPRHQTQVARLSGKHFFPLRCLASLGYPLVACGASVSLCGAGSRRVLALPPIVSWIPEEPLVSHQWVFLSTFQILVITLETAPFVPSALWFFKLWVTVEFTCSFSFCWVDSVLFFC